MRNDETKFSDGKISRLLEWLNGSGKCYVNPKIEVFEDPLVGRGIRLGNGMLTKNEVLISIPSSHQLNFHTVLHWIAKFNKNIFTNDNISIGEAATELFDDQGQEDPRIKAYGIFNQEELTDFNSFQLLCLFILAEWILLPNWSNGTITSWWKPFFDIFPTDDELRSIPTKWSLVRSDKNASILLESLPTASSEHKKRISQLLLADWNAVRGFLKKWTEEFTHSTIGMDELFSHFVHIYFVINSRCLYMEIPLKTDVKDYFTMVPFVDYLNHTNKASLHCYPEINKLKRNVYGLGEFSIRVGNHQYEKAGEELFLNYGAHSNDFLLAEYGFTTLCNEWNFIDLTPEFCNMFTDPKDITFLDNLGYWKDFTISKGEISYRILVAVSLLVHRDHRKTERFALGYITEEYFEPETSSVINSLLRELEFQYMSKIDRISEIQDDDWCKRNLLNLYEGYIEILRSLL